MQARAWSISRSWASRPSPCLDPGLTFGPSPSLSPPPRRARSPGRYRSISQRVRRWPPRGRGTPGTGLLVGRPAGEQALDVTRYLTCNHARRAAVNGNCSFPNVRTSDAALAAALAQATIVSSTPREHRGLRASGGGGGGLLLASVDTRRSPQGAARPPPSGAHPGTAHHRCCTNGARLKSSAAQPTRAQCP